MLSLSKYGVLSALGAGLDLLLLAAVLWGWSAFIMQTVVHPHIEPFFNIRSFQNKRGELFTPEPVHTVRDWFRLMFRGR